MSGSQSNQWHGFMMWCWLQYGNTEKKPAGVPVVSLPDEWGVLLEPGVFRWSVCHWFRSYLEREALFVSLLNTKTERDLSSPEGSAHAMVLRPRGSCLWVEIWALLYPSTIPDELTGQWVINGRLGLDVMAERMTEPSSPHNSRNK